MASGAPTVQEKRNHFNYHAMAVAFSGQITSPFNEMIESQASCAIPLSGGHAANRVDNYNLRDLVTFKAAYCTVTGSYSEKDDAFFTVVSATVEDLNFLGMVKIGTICGRIMCRHPYVNPEQPPAQPVEPSIKPLGSHFENVRIAGHPVTVKLHGKACQFDTYSTFRNNAGNPGTNGTIKSTLVESIDLGGAPGLEFVEPNAIHIDQFGTITFSELYVDQNARRLRMLRVDLACGFEGGGNASCPQGNGSSPGGGH